MIKKCLAILSLSMALFSPISTQADTILRVRDFGVSPDNTDNTKALQSLLQINRRLLESNEKVILKFERGDYFFSFSKAPERIAYVSNHDQTGNKKIAFDLKSMNDVKIDGQGAKFLFSGIGIPFAIENSEDIELKNFTINYTDPQITEVKIVERNSKGTTFKVSEPNNWGKKIYGINHKGEFQVKGEGWSNTPFVAMAFDPKTKHILYNTGDIEVNLRETKQEGDLFIAPHWNDKRLPMGTIVALRDYSRPTPAIWISESKDIEIEKVTINYANGMGIIAQRSKDIEVKYTKVVPERGRLSSTQADATHFVQCKGDVEVEHSKFTGMMDDAINVHGIYLKKTKTIDEYTAIFEYKHYQAWGFKWGDIGDEVRFITAKNMEAIAGSNTIAEIRPSNSPTADGCKEWIIRFRERLPENIDGVENVTWTPTVDFEYNVISNNRARGALFSSCRKTVCSHNYFNHTSGSAILVAGDCNGWFESGPVEYLIIRDNIFYNALTSRYQFTNAVISIYPEIPNIEQQTTAYHRNIIIENNVFKTFNTPLVYAHSVDGLRFVNNKVKYNKDFKSIVNNTDKIVVGKNVTNLFSTK